MSALPDLDLQGTRFTHVIGVGGIGTGILIELKGNETLARTESRMGYLLDARDYCKLHIVEHYIAALLAPKEDESRSCVLAIGNVGNDARGLKLLQEMSEIGINTRHVQIEGECETLFSVSFLYPDKSGGNITVANSAANALTEEQIESCRPDLASAGERGIALCLPEVPLKARSKFLSIATECGNYRVASFSAGEIENAYRLKMLSHVDLLAINLEEAAALARKNTNVENPGDVLSECERVAQDANPHIRISVSAGGEGVHVFDGKQWRHRAALRAKVVSTAGAGDALLAGIVAGLVRGLPLIDDARCPATAIDLGLLAASYSITSPHSIHPAFNMQALKEFARTASMESHTEEPICSPKNALQTRY